MQNHIRRIDDLVQLAVDSPGCTLGEDMLDDVGFNLRYRYVCGAGPCNLLCGYCSCFSYRFSNIGCETEFPEVLKGSNVEPRLLTLRFWAECFAERLGFDDV